MGSLAFGIFLAVVGLVLYFLKVHASMARVKNTVATVAILGGGVFGILGGMAYNDAGYCQHVRTVFGTESAQCDTGWYFLGWGSSTEYPHFITVANTTSVDAQGSAVSAPYSVRLADNWNGVVTQATRFAIPQDEEQFLTMARTFRSKERLVTTTLRPAVTSSLDSISNLFSMEEYYAGGQRDQYKTEFRDAMTKGRARVRQVTDFRDTMQTDSASDGAVANDLTEETDSVGSVATRRVFMEKVLNAEGAVIREVHDYAQYGIVVASAILENLDPDDLFEKQIQSRKDAASRRIVAQEERREQEEQRLLAIQTGKTEIAQRQAKAEVEQIQQTTEAETSRKLAVIKANQKKEEAQIAKQTSEIKLEQARIDAETQETLADAEAYERRVILEADNALQAKLDAWVTIQEKWAQAAADINVPSTVFNMGGGSDGSNAGTGNFGSVDAFMNLMTANAARQLALDPAIEGKDGIE